MDISGVDVENKVNQWNYWYLKVFKREKRAKCGVKRRHFLSSLALHISMYYLLLLLFVMVLIAAIIIASVWQWLFPAAIFWLLRNTVTVVVQGRRDDWGGWKRGQRDQIFSHVKRKRGLSIEHFHFTRNERGKRVLEGLWNLPKKKPYFYS